MKNCITYLVRASDKDIEEFNQSLLLIEKNLIPFCKDIDVIIFHEKDLEPFKDKIKHNVKLIFKEIKFKLPDYSDDILKEIPELYPHPTHQNGPIAYWHKGFTMGYRHMCKFFFCDIFRHISEYEYSMRLDTDSFIHSPLNYDIFEYMKFKDAIYSFIAPAIQLDNPLVCKDLNNIVKEWIIENRILVKENIDNIPNGKVYYTNYEICKVDWFLNDYRSNLFYKFINDTGKIYSARWGDHILRYLQMNLFCEQSKLIPSHGFTYQHGAIYKV